MTAARQNGDSMRDVESPAEVSEVVRSFYAAVAQDALLGPMFEEIAQVDWPAHLPRLSAFWCRALFGQPGYVGNPYAMHRDVHRRSPFSAAHFDRWLALFEASAQHVCGRAAALFIDRAHRIAQSLELGIATSRGLILRTDERLPPLALTEGATS